MRIFVVGAPSPIGGADTELSHTIKLWRRHEVEVHVIPTWAISEETRQELDCEGVVTHNVKPEEIPLIPLIEGNPVVSFCNSNLFKIMPALRKMGCKVCFSPCMTWIGDAEKECVRENGIWDVIHYQSEYQRGMIEPYYREFGFDPDNGYLIRGAFDLTGWDFDPLPHKRETMFVLGKLARCDADKWSADYFRVFNLILHRQKRLFMMGYSSLAHRKLGTIPQGSEWITANAIPVKEYYRQIHCLWTWNGGAAENWPRVGLEAMAMGVPVIAENRFGWQEMIVHGETGFLGDDDQAMAFYASWMAHDEAKRIQVAKNARDRLENVLARPDAIWQGWNNIFRKLGA